MPDKTLKFVAMNCTLKRSKDEETSSTEALLKQVVDALEDEGAEGEIVRVADFNVKPGVTSDEGEGDDWPALRQKVIAADILVIGAPIWLGQPSSMAKRILERMDAFLDEKDEQERTPAYGKVGFAVIVGNEDGAHHSATEICGAMMELGFTIPAGGSTYWVGEAMGSKEYKDFKSPPKAVASWTPMLVSNAVHLARLLKANQYPGKESKD
jgi:multimeric flavodoxin WrbA